MVVDFLPEAEAHLLVEVLLLDAGVRREGWGPWREVEGMEIEMGSRVV